MEKFNLVFTNFFTTSKSILWIISVLSWLFFICTGLTSIIYQVDFDYEIFWTIKTMGRIINNYQVKDYYPIQINTVMLYIIFIFTLLFGILGFLIYMIKSTCLKDKQVFEGMMGIWPRLHSFPLILISFLFLLGEYFYPYYYQDYCNNNDYAKYFNHMKDIQFFGLIFSLIALISLIFIYIVTNFGKDNWYAVLFIKKGTYSCLIILLWYYFSYMVYQVNEYIYPSMNRKTILYLRNTMGIFFSSIIGLGSLSFSFFFRDIVAAFMNLLIYLGLCIHFFLINIEIRNYYGNKWADGIIDIVMIVLSTAMIVFLIIKYRKECLQ